MANKHWIDQEKKFLKALTDVEIPNSNLDKVDFIDISKKSDINKISDGGGCYWIWTNEPVIHTLHKHKLPPQINGGEIIYNGIAKDDVKGRIFHHLFGYEDAGWSGISIDIYKNNSTSHRKKAMSSKGKVPYIIIKEKAKRNNKSKSIKKGDEVIKYKAIRTKEILLSISLSASEKQYIKNTKHSVYYFRNGIDISESKHNKYNFRVYFITGLSSLYLEYIEKKWREFGLPRLCSYSTGR